MNKINKKLEQACINIKPIYFDKVKFVVCNITEIQISTGQQIKIAASSKYDILTIFHGALTYQLKNKTFKTDGKNKEIIFLPNKSETKCKAHKDSLLFRISMLIDSTAGSIVSDVQMQLNQRIAESGYRFMGHWKLCRLFEKIKTELSNSYPFSEFKISLLIQDFLITFIRIYFSELSLQKTNHKQALITQIDAFIEHNLNVAVSTVDLADKCGLSSRQITRIIKEQKNMSPVNYIIKIKMQHAYKELENGSLSIKEIAANLGYQDISYFYRCFKKTFNTTPKSISK